MNILGIDPGQVSGWCFYDTASRRVVEAGQFEGHECDIPVPKILTAHRVVMERPKGYGPTRPQLVDCGYTAGRLVSDFSQHIGVEELTRLEVCKTLTHEVHDAVRVRNDATAWAALKLLHGGDNCHKKGGPLHGVKAHERAALAVAVAWAIREKQVAP